MIWKFCSVILSFIIVTYGILFLCFSTNLCYCKHVGLMHTWHMTCLLVAVTISWLTACNYRIPRYWWDICTARSQHYVWNLRQRLSYRQCLCSSLSWRCHSIWKLKHYIRTDDSRRVFGNWNNSRVYHWHLAVSIF